jgi:NAD(P)-dependent dehydrogenase (short-subunit alcohol dehydrogenase family)
VYLSTRIAEFQNTTMSKSVLVFGATGNQGGATVNALLASPQANKFTILAVTRNAASPSAKKLEEQGVKIVQGDLDDVEAVFDVAEKVAGGKIWGVFSVQVSPLTEHLYSRNNADDHGSCHQWARRIQHLSRRRKAKQSSMQRLPIT